MCAVSQERLTASGKHDRRRRRVQRRRATLLVATLVVLAVAAVVVVQLRRQITAQDAAVASPVASVDPGIGELPPSRTIATAGPVDINLPIDRKLVAFTLFRPVGNVAGVAMSPDGSWKHTVWPDEGIGPRTAGLDIAAPAGTIVYSPVSGHISGVRDYVLAGRPAGYQVDISPLAASDVVVRVLSITSVPIGRDVSSVCRTAGVSRPRVGTVVTAGVTCLGQVYDTAQEFSDVARPAIARYTSEGGNHVHLEVVRVGS